MPNTYITIRAEPFSANILVTRLSHRLLIGNTRVPKCGVDASWWLQKLRDLKFKAFSRRGTLLAHCLSMGLWRDEHGATAFDSVAVWGAIALVGLVGFGQLGSSFGESVTGTSEGEPSSLGSTATAGTRIGEPTASAAQPIVTAQPIAPAQPTAVAQPQPVPPPSPISGLPPESADETDCAAVDGICRLGAFISEHKEHVATSLLGEATSGPSGLISAAARVQGAAEHLYEQLPTPGRWLGRSLGVDGWWDGLPAWSQSLVSVGVPPVALFAGGPDEVVRSYRNIGSEFVGIAQGISTLSETFNPNDPRYWDAWRGDPAEHAVRQHDTLSGLWNEIGEPVGTAAIAFNPSSLAHDALYNPESLVQGRVSAASGLWQSALLANFRECSEGSRDACDRALAEVLLEVATAGVAHGAGAVDNVAGVADNVAGVADDVVRASDDVARASDHAVDDTAEIADDAAAAADEVLSLPEGSTGFGDEVASSGSALVDEAALEHQLIFQTVEVGGRPIRIAGTLQVDGTRLIVDDLSIFPVFQPHAGVSTFRPRDVLRYLHQLEDEAAALGFDTLEIRADRISGANAGRELTIVRDLSRTEPELVVGGVIDEARSAGTLSDDALRYIETQHAPLNDWSATEVSEVVEAASTIDAQRLEVVDQLDTLIDGLGDIESVDSSALESLRFQFDNADHTPPFSDESIIAARGEFEGGYETTFEYANGDAGAADHVAKVEQAQRTVENRVQDLVGNRGTPSGRPNVHVDNVSRQVRAAAESGKIDWATANRLIDDLARAAGDAYDLSQDVDAFITGG